MNVSKPEIDRKRAAAGEADEAAMPTGPRESLATSLKHVSTSIAIPEYIKPPISPSIHSFGYDQDTLANASRRLGHAWTSRMSKHIHPDYEIVVGYAKAKPSGTPALSLTMGLIRYSDLSKEPLEGLLEQFNSKDNPYVSTKRLTMRLHRVVVDRERTLIENSMPFKALVIEIGVYSRLKNSPLDKPSYIGKVKAFFPLHAAKMEVFINLDTL